MTADLPVYGPTEQFDDEDHTPAVVVRVAFALSREQLLTALSIGFTETNPDRNPHSLTVGQVRREVECWLATQALIELDRYIAQGQLTAYPPEAQPVMDALAAALDRAYPARRVAEERPVQRPVYGPGTVTLDTLDHGRITIDEPVWCTGHDGEQIVQRVDVTHVGVTVTGEYAGVEFLPACISWGPFAEERPEPLPLADVDEFPGMTPDELRELGAEVVRHGGSLFSKANELDRVRRAQS